MESIPQALISSFSRVSSSDTQATQTRHSFLSRYPFPLLSLNMFLNAGYWAQCSTSYSYGDLCVFPLLSTGIVAKAYVSERRRSNAKSISSSPSSVVPRNSTYSSLHVLFLAFPSNRAHASWPNSSLKANLTISVFPKSAQNTSVRHTG
jgi:hypothetical protein